MESINERISKAIETSKKRKIDIARDLRVSQPFISQLCAGQRQPSERTLFDLSKILGVNYEWLRTGEGEMMSPEGDAEIFTAWAARHLSKESNEFKRRFMKVIIGLTESEWALLETKLREMLDEIEKPPDGE